MIREDAQPPNQIFGFISLSICEVFSTELSKEQAKAFPRIVPGVKIGRLAVHKNFQKQGIGYLLLSAAFNKFPAVASHVGGIGLFVDAKDEAAQGYYL